MKTLIVGAGSRGCLYAGLMAEGGADVSLFDINEEKAELIDKTGIIIRENDGRERKISVPCFSDIEKVPAPDLVIVLIKAYNTERAGREISFILRENTAVLTLQNGLGNIEKLAKNLPEKQLFAGVTSMSALELSEGHVAHTGSGLTIVGPVDPKSLPVSMDIARFFNNCGVDAGSTNELDALCWRRLVVDSAVKPLTAIYGITNGELVKKPEAARDMASLVIEGVSVAQKIGVPLNYGEMWAGVLETCRQGASLRSSMLLDVEAGRLTEIEAINGSIVSIGEMYGVDTPTQMRMLKEVTAIQRGRGR